MCEEGVFAGFSSGYVTESPSRDEIALRSCVLGRGDRVFMGVGGCFCTGRVFFAGFSSGYVTESPSRDETTLQGQYRPPVTELPSGEGDGVFDPRIGEDANENN